MMTCMTERPSGGISAHWVVSKGLDILIISHGGFIKEFLNMLQKQNNPDYQPGNHKFGNTSVSVF